MLKYLNSLSGHVFKIPFVDMLVYSTSLAGAVNFVHKYVFADWQFVITLSVIVFIDTLLGLMLAYKLKNIESNKFAKVLNKMIVYILLLIATHTLTHYKVQGQESLGIFIFVWIDNIVYAAIMVRELISILENTGKLGIFVAPSWIMARLKDFDDKGKINDK